MKTKRLLSLDVFRGMTVALMITVNNPGSWSFVYAPFKHAKWDGCTPTDLVFPFFLFVVGMAMWYAFKSFDYTLNKESAVKIIRRTFLIFVIGMMLNAIYPIMKLDFSDFRVMGVLQRIALAYGIGAFICLKFKQGWLYCILPVLLIFYWAILYFFGGTEPFSLDGNISSSVDVFLFGKSHIYNGYGIPFDPEGLLGVVSSVGTVVLGYLTGKLLSNSATLKITLIQLLVFGTTTLFLGQLWGLVFPINKALWSSSFVLYTAGLAMLTLALLIWLIDVKNFKKWTNPFVAFGMNPLFIFVFAGVWARAFILIRISTSDTTSLSLKDYIFSDILSPIFGNYGGSLAYALIHIVLFWAIVAFMYKRKIFVKI